MDWLYLVKLTRHFPQLGSHRRKTYTLGHVCKIIYSHIGNNSKKLETIQLSITAKWINSSIFLQ